jgi:beta-glucanase (GH16 family)
VFTLDGKDWATITNSNVSSVPMVLDMQTANGACGTWNYCAGPSTPHEVDMDVDWVVAYAPTSSATRQEAITRAVNRASRHIR